MACSDGKTWVTHSGNSRGRTSQGSRWRDLLAVNPGIVDANHIAAGSQIYLPAVASSLRTASKIMVRRGETLTRIAQTQFGHAAYWSCIAHANPAIQECQSDLPRPVALPPRQLRAVAFPTAV